MNDIGEIIKLRRSELNLTLEDIGNAVGVGKSTVKKWENGFISNMKRDKIALLADILQVSPLTFITGEITPVSDNNDKKRKDSTNISKLDNQEQQLLESFRTLNNDGKEKAVNYVSDLAEIPKYTEFSEAKDA